MFFSKCFDFFFSRLQCALEDLNFLFTIWFILHFKLISIGLLLLTESTLKGTISSFQFKEVVWTFSSSLFLFH